mmetsp:Transcript_22107/g.42483  ORF Transcript_22107/g.42483 Transcript_22107/m.42483 type:complete len:98 (+) Transcript_22107:150-443(+)
MIISVGTVLNLLSHFCPELLRGDGSASEEIEVEELLPGPPRLGNRARGSTGAGGHLTECGEMGDTGRFCTCLGDACELGDDLSDFAPCMYSEAPLVL